MSKYLDEIVNFGVVANHGVTPAATISQLIGPYSLPWHPYCLPPATHSSPSLTDTLVFPCYAMLETAEKNQWVCMYYAFLKKSKLKTLIKLHLYCPSWFLWWVHKVQIASNYFSEDESRNLPRSIQLLAPISTWFPICTCNNCRQKAHCDITQNVSPIYSPFITCKKNSRTYMSKLCEFKGNLMLWFQLRQKNGLTSLPVASSQLHQHHSP